MSVSITKNKHRTNVGNGRKFAPLSVTSTNTSCGPHELLATTPVSNKSNPHATEYTTPEGAEFARQQQRQECLQWNASQSSHLKPLAIFSDQRVSSPKIKVGPSPEAKKHVSRFPLPPSINNNAPTLPMSSSSSTSSPTLVRARARSSVVPNRPMEVEVPPHNQMRLSSVPLSAGSRSHSGSKRVNIEPLCIPTFNNNSQSVGSSDDGDIAMLSSEGPQFSPGSYFTPTNADAMIELPNDTELDQQLEHGRRRQDGTVPMTTSDVLADPIFCVGNPYLRGELKMPEVISANKRRRIATSTSKLEKEFILMPGSNARGSYGTVLKCRKRFDGCVYAVKRLTHPYGKGRQANEQMQEVYKLAACSSPHIVRYYDAWVEDGRLHIQCEFCEGGSLSSQVQKSGAFDEAKLHNVATQICKGLVYMHGLRIYHLDVKPDNILDDGQGMFKLCDLGLQRASGDCRYLPFEALQERVHEDYRDRVDVYSLGASLYHLAVGKSFTSLPSTSQPPPLQHLSAHFNQLLMAMLEKDATKRPTALACLNFLAPQNA